MIGARGDAPFEPTSGLIILIPFLASLLAEIEFQAVLKRHDRGKRESNIV